MSRYQEMKRVPAILLIVVCAGATYLSSITGKLEWMTLFKAANQILHLSKAHASPASLVYWSIVVAGIAAMKVAVWLAGITVTPELTSRFLSHRLQVVA